MVEEYGDIFRLWSGVGRTDRRCGGVSPQVETIPFPSRTPFMQTMLRRDNQVMLVNDLGTRLSCIVQGDPLSCLVARHLDGPMATCIDAYVAPLETVDTAVIWLNGSEDIESLGSATLVEHNVEVVVLQRRCRLRQDTVTS
jgi:hypothetical protein